MYPRSVSRWFRGFIRLVSCVAFWRDFLPVSCPACGKQRIGRKGRQARQTALGGKTIMKTTKLTRRGLLGAASATWATAILRQPANAAAAEFDFKLGVNTPETHPLTIRLTEAAKAIGEQSSGRLNVTVFSNGQLGGDPEMLSQVRS